jgi:hypothetical protein
MPTGSKGYILDKEGKRTGDTIVVPMGNYNGSIEYGRNNITGEQGTLIKDNKGNVVWSISDSGVYAAGFNTSPFDASNQNYGGGNSPWHGSVHTVGWDTFSQHWLAAGGNLHDLYGG